MIHRNGEPETAEHRGQSQSPDRRDAAALLDRVGRLTLRWIAYVYRRFLYRHVMRLAHRFNWHYAPVGGPDGNDAWCQWCGLRYTIPKRNVTIVGDALRKIGKFTR